MCGIAPLWGATDQRPIETMLGVQAHRGPDGTSVAEAGDGRGTLGHCRLAIIDPEGGARSDEEAYYRALPAEAYETPQPVLDLVDHWDTRIAA